MKLRSSEITGTCILLVVLVSSKVSGRATKLHEKGHFARIFESGGGARVPVPFGFYVHAYDIVHIFVIPRLLLFCKLYCIALVFKISLKKLGFQLFLVL